MAKKSTFHVKINGGPEQVIKTRTGIYQLAAAAALAMLDYEESEEDDEIEIWAPSVMPEYGPYFYIWNGHQMLTAFKR